MKGGSNVGWSCKKKKKSKSKRKKKNKIISPQEEKLCDHCLQNCDIGDFVNTITKNLIEKT